MVNRTDGNLALKGDGVDYKNSIERKVDEIGKRTRNVLKGGEDCEIKVKEKIRSIILENEIKTQKEEIEDLAESMAGELAGNNQTDIRVEAKKIRLEIQKWEDENPGQMNDFKKEEFKKNFIDEVKKLNPDLKAEELNKAGEYSQLVSDTYFSESVIDGQKDEALQANGQMYSPGKLENAWTDLKVTTNFLAKKPEEIKEIKYRYELIRSNLRNVNLPTNFKETRSFENVISSFNDSGVSNLFSRTQGYLGWADRIDKLTGGWLSKKVNGVGMKMVGKVGNQAVQEFTTNALGTIAREGFQKGISTVLSGILGGGVKVATAAVAEGAVAAAGGAAATAAGVAGGPIGWIILGAMAVKKMAGKILESLGINLKNGLGDGFEKVGGAIVGGAMFLVGLPSLLIGAISASAATPVLLFVLVGLFVFQMFQGNAIASLVPPKGTETETDYAGPDISGDIGSSPYIPSDGPIVLPTRDPEQLVTGEMVVEMAASLINKVCYYYGGGHGAGEPVLGVDPKWGKYVGNNQGSKNERHIYGPDCSGFISWVFYQFGIRFTGTTWDMADNSEVVNSADDLRLGDIGFTSGEGHVGIFAGRDSNGNQMWIHDGSGGTIPVCGGQLGYVKMTVANNYFVIYRRIL